MCSMNCKENGVINRSFPLTICSQISFYERQILLEGCSPLCQMGLGKICFTFAQLFPTYHPKFGFIQNKSCWFKEKLVCLKNQFKGRGNMISRFNWIQSFENLKKMKLSSVSKIFRTHRHSGRFILYPALLKYKFMEN